MLTYALNILLPFNPSLNTNTNVYFITIEHMNAKTGDLKLKSPVLTMLQESFEGIPEHDQS